ncbi:MAG: hypothetical protein DI589_22965 [Shinella sp.]|nr:MAG: hypothetical protein DI589_22965 [Shinella sp.]
MAEQLNFFDRLTPTATVLPFPPRRLQSLIQAAARRVLAHPSAEQPQAMLNEVGILMLRYMTNGIDQGTAYQLAMTYEQAIKAEIHRLRWLGCQPNPKGAA